MNTRLLAAVAAVSLTVYAEEDFEKLGACSGLYEVGGDMARWRAVQNVAKESGQKQTTTADAYDAGWWFGMARGDWRELYVSFVADYGAEQAESWRLSAITDNGCETISG